MPSATSTTTPLPSRATPTATQKPAAPPHETSQTLLSDIALLTFRPLTLVAMATTLVLTAGATNLLWMNVVITAVDVLTLVLVGRVLRRRGRTLRDLVNVNTSDLGWGFVLFLILAVTFGAALFLGNLIVYQGPPPTSTAAPVSVPLVVGIWSLTIFPIGTALAEESLYRGVAQPAWQARLGHVAGLVGVAVVFGVQHLAFALTTPQAALSRVIALTVVGVVLGLLYRWRRRLSQLVVAHWLINALFIGVPLMTMALA